MSELTLLVLQLGFLLLLWVFVFAIVYALRSDLFGQRVRKLQPEGAGDPLAALVMDLERVGTSSSFRSAMKSM